MGSPSTSVSEIILVLCPSIFHDAFRAFRPIDVMQYRNWMSSRFVTNFIIERQAGLPEGIKFATTSKQAFDTFVSKFHEESPSVKQLEIVSVLRNAILIAEHPSINNLSIDESVLVICDIVYSRSNFPMILISNIPKTTEKAETFYRKKDPNASIPFPIYTAEETESFLHGRYPDLSAIIDEKIKISKF